jgi:hypothetical protein
MLMGSSWWAVAYCWRVIGKPLGVSVGVEVGRTASVAKPAQASGKCCHAWVVEKCWRNCCNAAGVVKMIVGRSCVRARRSSIFF